MNLSTKKYISTKTYPHSKGLSCAFRQWKADSHCKYLHGYAFQVKFWFGANELDVRNWVVDFGSLKSLYQILEDTFDHKTLVAHDDPQLDLYYSLHKAGVIQLCEVPATGCEAFAEMIFEVASQWLIDAGYGSRCVVLAVEVSEHEGNSAIYCKSDS